MTTEEKIACLLEVIADLAESDDSIPKFDSPDNVSGNDIPNNSDDKGLEFARSCRYIEIRPGKWVKVC